MTNIARSGDEHKPPPVEAAGPGYDLYLDWLLTAEPAPTVEPSPDREEAVRRAAIDGKEQGHSLGEIISFLSLQPQYRNLPVAEIVEAALAPPRPAAPATSLEPAAPAAAAPAAALTDDEWSRKFDQCWDHAEKLKREGVEYADAVAILRERFQGASFKSIADGVYAVFPAGAAAGKSAETAAKKSRRGRPSHPENAGKRKHRMRDPEWHRQREADLAEVEKRVEEQAARLSAKGAALIRHYFDLTARGKQSKRTGYAYCGQRALVAKFGWHQETVSRIVNSIFTERRGTVQRKAAGKSYVATIMADASGSLIRETARGYRDRIWLALAGAPIHHGAPGHDADRLAEARAKVLPN